MNTIVIFLLGILIGIMIETAIVRNGQRGKFGKKGRLYCERKK